MAKLKMIVLDIGQGDEIQLTHKEALALKAVLNETFPDKETVIVPQPYPQPYPVYPYHRPRSIWDDWTVTWGNDTTTGDVLYMSSGG